MLPRWIALPKMSSMLGSSLALVVTRCRASGATAVEVERSTPDEGAGTTPSDKRSVTPVDDIPASGGGGGASTPDDEDLAPGEDSPASSDDASALIDGLSSSWR